MKAFALFLVRLVTGGSLVAFAASKIIDTPAAIDISDKLYMGYASTLVAQHGLAALGAVLGIFVILGFLRTFSYGVQFVVFLVAAAALARVSVVLPVEFASGTALTILLLPSFSLLLLSLVLIVWRDDDFLALDRFIDFRKSDLADDAAHAAVLKAPVAAAAVAHEAHAEPAHDDHGHGDHGHHAEAAHEDHAPAHAEPAHTEQAHAEPAHAEQAHDDHGHAPHGEEPHAAHAEAPHDDHGHAGHGHDDHGHHAEPAHDDHAKAHHAH